MEPTAKKITPIVKIMNAKPNPMTSLANRLYLVAICRKTPAITMNKPSGIITVNVMRLSPYPKLIWKWLASRRLNSYLVIILSVTFNRIHQSIYLMDHFIQVEENSLMHYRMIPNKTNLCDVMDAQLLSLKLLPFIFMEQ